MHRRCVRRRHPRVCPDVDSPVPDNPMARRRPAAIVAGTGHGDHPALRPPRRRPAPRPRHLARRVRDPGPALRAGAVRCGWRRSPTPSRTAAAGSPTRSRGWRRRGWSRARSSPEDGRGILATLTDKGHDLLVRAAPTHVAGVRAHLVNLSSDPTSPPWAGSSTRCPTASSRPTRRGSIPRLVWGRVVWPFVAPPASRWPGPVATQERRVAAHGSRPHCVASAAPRPAL